MKLISYRDLVVWRRSMDLAEQTYQLVSQFPADERYGLSSQLRRAAISIPSNIAEGAGSGTDGRYVYHLRMARGSEHELQTQLELALRLKYAGQEEVAELLDSASQVGRMLNGLIRSIEEREAHRRSGT
jgi:four helix bundle protein